MTHQHVPIRTDFPMENDTGERVSLSDTPGCVLRLTKTFVTELPQPHLALPSASCPFRSHVISSSNL